MAKTIADQLKSLGLIDKTPAEHQQQEWLERQKRYRAACQDKAEPLPAMAVTVNLRTAVSSDIVPETPIQVQPETSDVPRVKGEMVWIHKTAPVLQIQGKPTLTADDYVKGRRRD